MGRNLENRNEWYKQKYLKFGADLDKEYCEKLKQTIKDDKDYKSIAEWIKEYEVDTIVLGYPKNMNNTEGKRCEKTKIFQKHLEKAFPNITVILWDERMSTMAAERSLLAADMSRKKRKNIIDKMAAVHILQGYLDKKQNGKC